MVGRGTGNSPDGVRPKTVLTDVGPVEIGFVLVIAEVIGDLALERGLQQPVGQLLQPTRILREFERLPVGSRPGCAEQATSPCFRSLSRTGLSR
ncbi:hypothetical protein GCM10027200_15470 [Lentzea nigeriaca]